MATKMKPGIKKVDTAIEEAGGSVRDLFPTRVEEDRLADYMREVPEQFHDRIWTIAQHIGNTTFRAMAAAAGALIAEQIYEPNSSYGMWPTAVGRGSNVVPGTVYSFGAFMSGQVGPSQGAVTFTRGQRFFGLTTGHIDTANGWTFAGNTVKLQTDAISGIETDTSFVNWNPEIVKARLIKGEYEGFAIRELTAITFTAAAYVPQGMPAVPCVEGLSVLYWDSRCLNKELTWLDFDTMSFEDMVRDLVGRMEGGKINKRLLLEYVPEHLRGARRR
jgi:hypothetical protein